MNELNHFDDRGNSRMVDVSEKPLSDRAAVATGRIQVSPQILSRIQSGDTRKGDVLGVARVAGIMAAKETSRLIPMCHPLNITGVNLDFQIDGERASIEATATVRITGKTGVEMEALTAVSVALLTIYDMCKSMDKSMRIEGIQLLSKTGGKSGDYQNPKGDPSR